MDYILLFVLKIDTLILKDDISIKSINNNEYEKNITCKYPFNLRI